MTNSLPSWDLANRLYGTCEAPRARCERVTTPSGIRHIVVVASLDDFRRAESISDDGWVSTQHHTLPPPAGWASRTRDERWRVCTVAGVEVRYLASVAESAAVYCPECRCVTRRRVIMRRVLACTHIRTPLE